MDFKTQYEKMAHALQSGVAYDPDKRAQEPKHLRTGINMRAVEHAALVRLLVAKGVIATAEYEEALLDAMRDEKERYERYLSEQLGGASVTLG